MNMIIKATHKESTAYGGYFRLEKIGGFFQFTGMKPGSINFNGQRTTQQELISDAFSKQTKEGGWTITVVDMIEKTCPECNGTGKVLAEVY